MNKYTVNQTSFFAVCTSVCTGTLIHLSLTQYVPPPHTRHKFQQVSLQLLQMLLNVCSVWRHLETEFCYP